MGFYPIDGDAATISLSSGFSFAVSLDVGTGVDSLLLNNAAGTSRSHPTAELLIGANSFSSLSEFIGDSASGGGRGEIIQTGSSNTISYYDTSGPFTMGTHSGDYGEYDLSSGNFTVNNSEYIGYGGNALFDQSGGTHQVNSGGSNLSEPVYLAYSGTSNSTYLLSGGTFSVVGTEYDGFSGTGNFIQSGGTHQVGGGLNIGDGGIGLYTQTAGATSIGSTSGLSLAASSTGSATYNISGGTLATTAGSLYVGGSSNGPAGVGTLIVTGTAAVTVQGTLYAYNTAGTGINFSGGSIIAGGLNFSGNPALFNWTAGSLEITSSVTFSPNASNSATGQAFGSALTLNNGQSLTLDGAETIAGVGSVQGPFTVTLNTGALNICSTLLINYAGGLILSGGEATVITMTNQSLFSSTGTLQVHSVNNSGAFLQTGVLFETGNFTNSGSATIGGSQSWFSNTSLTNNAGTAVFNSDAGAGGANLTVNVTGGTVTFASTQHLAGLNISSGATSQVTGAGTGHRSVIFTPALSVSGTLDLTGNDLDVQGGSLAAIRSLIVMGYNAAGGGKWNGTGITSSTAAGDTNHLTALGVILNTAPGGAAVYTSFDGATVAANDVLVKYTYYGDANLDGKLDGSDYSLIDSGYSTHASGWYNGDFNYDNVINGSDYALIDNAFNTQGAQLNSQVASATTQLAAGTSAVPEPEPLVAILIASLLLSFRRRGTSAA